MVKFTTVKLILAADPPTYKYMVKTVYSPDAAINDLLKLLNEWGALGYRAIHIDKVHTDFGTVFMVVFEQCIQ